MLLFRLSYKIHVCTQKMLKLCFRYSFQCRMSAECTAHEFSVPAAYCAYNAIDCVDCDSTVFRWMLNMNRMQTAQGVFETVALSATRQLYAITEAAPRYNVSGFSWCAQTLWREHGSHTLIAKENKNRMKFKYDSGAICDAMRFRNSLTTCLWQTACLFRLCAVIRKI